MKEIHVRGLSKKRHDWFKKCAKKNNRSLSGECLSVLEAHYDFENRKHNNDNIDKYPISPYVEDLHE